MHHTFIQTSIGALLGVTLALPGAALAYDNKDAIRACESRLRSDYGLIDLREARAEQLPGEKNYRVEGKTKVDGTKYPWFCAVRDRRAVDVKYRGPRPHRPPPGDHRPPPGGGGIHVRPIGSGNVEVGMPNGCRSRYDRRGVLIGRSGSCSSNDRRRADEAVDEYFYDQRHGGGGNRRPGS